MIVKKAVNKALVVILFLAASISAQEPLASQTPGDILTGFAVGQNTRLLAPDGSTADRFGSSVAMDGLTAVVGAPNDDANRGAVYVFVRTGTDWVFEQKLTASDGQAAEFFGSKVAISGDTIIVGAPEEYDVSQLDAKGAAYIFGRTAGVWQQDRKLVASDRQIGDKFGDSVAISANVAAVGARGADVAGNNNQGAVYIFNGSGTVWIEQTKIVAADGEASDEFGTTLALDGSTFITGVPRDTIGGRANQGSAYVYSGSGAVWSLDSKLESTSGMNANDRFGFSVAIGGNIVAVGAVGYDAPGGVSTGAVFVFQRNGSTWPFLNLIYSLDGRANDAFGSSVGISGDLLVAGAQGAFINMSEGAAYIFKRFGNDYFQQQKFSAGDSSNSDSFGETAAISGNSILVGSPNRTVGTNTTQGVIYSFRLLTDNWMLSTVIPEPFNEAGAGFGSSVAISDDLAVIGAPFSGGSGIFNIGAARIYRRNGAAWEPAGFYSAGSADEKLGSSVAVYGNRQEGFIVLGAPGGVVGGVAGRGRVVVLRISNGSITSVFELVHPSPAIGDRFGASVSIWDDTIVVGSPGRDVSSQSDQGSAIVFRKTSPDTWSFVTELTANFGASFDEMGNDVDVFGTTIAASSRRGGISDTGSVSVFTRTPGGTIWTEQTEIIPGDGSANDIFGQSVAIWGDTIVVGSSEHNLSAGAAYVLVGGGAVWSLQQKLTSSVPGARFGWDVDVNGNSAIVSQCCLIPSRVEVFERTFSTWAPVRTLQSAVTDDSFGFSAALSGSRLVVGLPTSDSTTGFPRTTPMRFAPDQGAAAIFSNAFVPTAANASIGGRVLDANGSVIRNALVTLTGENGEVAATRTNSFGYYRFDAVATGQTVTVGVQAKGRRFGPRVISFSEDIADLDFAAQPSLSRSVLSRITR